MQDIVMDWLYLLTTTFAICVLLYIAHLVVYKFDLLSLISGCVLIIETYFWTSIFLLCLTVAVMHNYLELKHKD